MAKKIDLNKIKKQINNDSDFIYCPRLGNSIKKLLDIYPDGVDNKRIAKLLLMKEEEVEDVFNSALKKIRKNLKIKD
jgi:hypothetical protein